MSAIAHVLEGTPSRASVALVESADAPVPWALVTDPGPSRPHNEDRWRVDASSGTFALAGIVDFAHNRPECLGMATTLVVATIADGGLTVAHVGDSRADLLRDGALRRLTRDHSIGQQMLDAGRMTESQVRRLPARGILTRALGIETEPPVDDVVELDWRAGDLLMLCSDGLSDSLDDTAIAHALDASGATLGGLASALIVAALARGCADDSTVLLAGGARAPAASH